MKKYYITADTHFGHEKMIEYCGRPVGFERLIIQGLKIITKDDILIHLGDVCIGNDSQWHEYLMEGLPDCKKILVKGNHDRKSNSWYYDNGWDFVCNMFVDKIQGKEITFSHEPFTMLGDGINIHGHLHNTGNKEGFDNEHYMNISLENLNYKPVLLKHLLSNK